jgi:hypothetical protein
MLLSRLSPSLSPFSLSLYHERVVLQHAPPQVPHRDQAVHACGEEGRGDARRGRGARRVVVGGRHQARHVPVVRVVKAAHPPPGAPVPQADAAVRAGNQVVAHPGHAVKGLGSGEAVLCIGMGWA